MNEQKDMFGNIVRIGDTIAYIDSGTQYFTSSVVTKLSETRCYFRNDNLFAMEDAFRSFDKIFSLTALNVKICNGYHSAIKGPGIDAVGHKLSVGDKVLYIKYHAWSVGYIRKMSAQTCVVGNDCDSMEKDDLTRRYYSDVISLTAIHFKGDCKEK